MQLPVGPVYWRVRAYTGTESGAWTSASFTRGPLVGPELVSPAGGAPLPQPDEPPLLTWTPVGGATGYTVEISQDHNFTDAGLITTYQTKASSYVVPAPQVATTYYWRVKAAVGTGLFTPVVRGG